MKYWSFSVIIFQFVNWKGFQLRFHTQCSFVYETMHTLLVDGFCLKSISKAWTAAALFTLGEIQFKLKAKEIFVLYRVYVSDAHSKLYFSLSIAGYFMKNITVINYFYGWIFNILVISYITNGAFLRLKLYTVRVFFRISGNDSVGRIPAAENLIRKYAKVDKRRFYTMFDPSIPLRGK